MKKRFDEGLGGFILLPCELIDKNGDNLKECILKYSEDWGYGVEFEKWTGVNGSAGDGEDPDDNGGGNSGGDGGLDENPLG